MENKILLQYISYCTTQNIRIHSLIYDGFTANIDDTIDLSELSEYVRENTGFKLSFVIKPMVSTIIIPDNALDLSNRITYESVKENFEKHCAKIMNPIVFVDYDIVLSREHLKNKYENLFYHKVKKESYEQTSFISDWLKDFDMKTYQGIGLYPPPLICPENVYNTYVSYPWISYSGEESSDIEWFFNHLKLMVSNDSNAYNYVLYWIAHIIQKPGIKTETLISFVGEEGVGKSLFVKLLNRLIGDEKMMETNNPENYIFGRCANWKNKTLCVLNDFNPAETRGCHREMFKQFITETKFTCEKKGVDSYV